MDKKNLESVMKKYGDTQATLAKVLGISRTCFNNKINERDDACFTQPEMKAIKNRYNLTANDIDEIFFAKAVS